MKALNQKGSLHLGLLLGVVLLAAVAFTGYRVWNNQHGTTSNNDSAVQTSSATVPAAIHTKADLTQTGKVLDDTGSQLDSGLNDSSLDGDINSML